MGVILLFRDTLARSSTFVVNGYKETCTYYIYTVSKYQVAQQQWCVSFYPSGNSFKCCCKRMESFGLPCVHIVALLVYLNYPELPNSLILERLTKNAKHEICGTSTHRSNYWDSNFSSRYGAYVFRSMMLGKLISENGKDYNEQMDRQLATIREIELKRGLRGSSQAEEMENGEDTIRNPKSCRTKGRGVASSSGTWKNPQRLNRCSACGEPGHNKKTCGPRSQHEDTTGAG